MPLTLPSIGTVQYNGYLFAGPRVRTSIEVSPVYDSARRVAMYYRYRLNVIQYITDDPAGLGGSGADCGINTFNAITLLNKPGQVLAFSGLGYGPIQIGGSAARDVIYGPMPQVVSFRPVGATGVMELNWKCEVHVANCSTIGLKGVLGQLVEYNFEESFGIDTQGLTTQTAKGHLTIAINRVFEASNNISTTADDQRDLFAPIVSLGFRLVDQQYSLSEDKSRLDFQHIYKEIPGDNALPDHCSEIKVSHRTSFERFVSQRPQIASTIAGHVETVKPFQASYGWLKVLLILRDRLSKARAANPNLLLTNLEITEDVFQSRRVDFSLQYWIAGATVDQILQASGMFQDTTNVTDWATWTSSMLETAWTSRGYAGLSVPPGEQQLVDHRNPNGGINSSPGDVTIPYSFSDTGSLSNDTGSKGYVDWDHKISIHTHPNSTTHYPLPTSPPSTTTGQDQTLKLGTPQAVFAPQVDQSLPAAITQTAGQRPIYVVSRGFATRMNAPVELPQLIQQILQQAGFTVLHSPIERESYPNYFGAELHAARWYIVFVVGTQPSNIGNAITGSLTNLTTGTSDDANKY